MQWPLWAKCLVVIGLCLITYGDQLDGQFVFDDYPAVKNNKLTKGTHHPWTEVFRHDYWGTHILSPLSHKSYRPLTTLTFRLETQLWKEPSPFRMKLTNLFLHILISCLILDFGELFARDSHKTSFLAGVLFAVHPVHTEAVSGIVGRADLLATLTFLIAVRIYFKTFIEKSSSMKPLMVSLLVFLTVIGVLCKETAITLTLVCAAFDVLYNTNLLQMKTKLQDWKEVPYLRLIGLAALTVLVGCSRFYTGPPQFQPEDNPFAVIEDKTFRAINAIFLHSINAWLLICPDWLSFDWSIGCITPISSWSDPRLLCVLLYFFVLLFIGISSVFKRRAQIAALILVVVPFLPASGVIHVGFVIAERILYMPSIGWCLLMATGFRRLLKRSRGREFAGVAVKALFVLTVLIFVQKSRFRASEWNDEKLLYDSALRVCPMNAKVHYNIANIAAKRGDPQSAISFYRRAIELYPNFDSALMNLGNVYRDRGDLDNAEYFLRRALGSMTIIDKRAAAEMNLGIVMAMRKKYMEALQHYNRALKARPYYPVCYFNMGNAYIELKQFELAQKNFETALNLDRTMELAWKNLLTLLYNEGKYEEVIAKADEGLATLPEQVDFHFPRANALAKLQRNEEAEQVFLYIIEQRPREAMYLGNLGVLYHLWRKYEKSLIYYEKALEVNPNLQRIREALVTVKRKLQNERELQSK